MSSAGRGDAERAGGLGQSRRLPPPLPGVLVTGWPPYPAETTSELSRLAGLEFTWEREREGGWEPAGRGLGYTPGGADLGRRLRLVGRRPGAVSEPAELCLESTPVRAGPGPCPANRGHRLTTQPLDPDRFRLVTYNMLADFYVLFYRRQGVDYLPPELHHDIEYRKQGLLLQLLGYHADVMCLQEVDQELFESFWRPMLGAAGFCGTFAVKQGPTDGIATFWSDKFRLVSSERHVIAQLALSDDPLFDDVRRALDGNTGLRQSLTELPQVLQLTLLEESTPHSGRQARRLLVANTHLYWNLATEHLRALQVGVCLRHVQRRMDALAAEEGAADVTLVFSGDFNSQPHQSVYHLMTTGQLTVQDFNDCADQAVPDVTFSHQYQLDSAYGTPEVTSSTSEFTGTLDYIFYMRDRLKLEQVVPLPTPEEVRAAGHLPIAEFPSDHLALTADLHWRD